MTERTARQLSSVVMWSPESLARGTARLEKLVPDARRYAVRLTARATVSARRLRSRAWLAAWWPTAGDWCSRESPRRCCQMGPRMR